MGHSTGCARAGSFVSREVGWGSGWVTVWSIFKVDTKYFQSSTQPFMLNFRVQDLDELVEALRDEAVWIDPKREDYDYGHFAWIMDPAGNRIELWEPPFLKGAGGIAKLLRNGQL